MRRPLPFGKYLLLERINVGGMAEIFIAKAFGVEGFERILAIKRILPTMAEDAEFISMFIDEARISVQLNHANIVHIHELGRYGDTYFIAMEYVSGKDLRAVLEYYQREQLIMPVAQAVYVASRMCDGLDHAHRKKDARGADLHIVHRDVSPQNVLLSFDGEVKLIDFGIAKAAGRLQKTQAGILKGKFGYMSPEQVRGLELDHRSDIFAVGVVLYEMLTGQRLFTGESDFSVLERVRDAVVPPPRELNVGIPEGLETILLRALDGDREDRYQWASDLQEDLMRFLLSGDAIYGAKHLSVFLRSAFADDLVVEAQRMERYASIDRSDELDSAQATTNYGPRPDLAAASAHADEDDLTPIPPPAAAASAPALSDRTMITDVPATPAASTGSGEWKSRGQGERLRTPERGQVVIGHGQQKYDGETYVGAVPATPAAALAPPAAPLDEDAGERTFVGELPPRSAAPQETFVGGVAARPPAPPDNADKTFVGELPKAAPVGAPIASAGAIPEEDDDEQDTRMLEAAEFAAQGFDASSLPPAEDDLDGEDPDDLTDPAMRLAARPEPSWEDEAANASASGWGLPDAPPAPKPAIDEDPAEEWSAPAAAPIASTGSAASAAAVAARDAEWGADPVTRLGPPSDPNEASDDEREDLRAAPVGDDDGYGDGVAPGASGGDADDDDDDDDAYGASSGDGYGDADDDAPDDDGYGGAYGDGDAPEGDDAASDDGYGEDEDEDPRTRLPDAPYDTGSDDEAWEDEDTSTPAPAPSPVAPKKVAASAGPGAGGRPQGPLPTNPKVLYIGGSVVLGLLIVGLLIAALSGGGPELVVHVDPASARLTVNGQTALPGIVVANQAGTYLVRAEASGYLSDEAEIELTADDDRREITLRLGVAPPPSVEPTPADPKAVAAAGSEPVDPAPESGGEGKDEPARAFFLGDVAGAEVRLDGALVGTLPEFETGALVGGRTYTYSVSREGYQTETGEFTAVEGKVMEIEVALEAIAKPAPTPVAAATTTQPAAATTTKPSTTKPAVATATPTPTVRKTTTVRSRPARTKMGKLAASSKPSGAAIYVDGKKMNRVTPVGLGSPLELPVGEHTIVFKLGERASAPRKITVTEDGITKLANVPIP